MGSGGGGSGRALVLFGFGSVWLRDLSMQLCFGFASDVFAKLHIYLIERHRFNGIHQAWQGNCTD